MPSQTLSNATIAQQDYGTGLADTEARDPISAAFVGAGDAFATQYHTCDLTADWSANEITISAGTAYLEADSNINVQTSSGGTGSYDRDWFGSIAVPVSIPQTTIALESGANTFWVELDLSQSNAVSIVWDVDASTSGTHSLVLGEADTDTEVLTTLNDAPNTDHGSITATDLSAGEMIENGDRVATRAWTISGNIDHFELGTINSDDHHTRPAAGDGLDDSADTFHVAPSEIDHDTLAGGTASSAHHARYSDAEARTAIEDGFLDQVTGSNGHVIDFAAYNDNIEFRTSGSRTGLICNEVYMDQTSSWFNGTHGTLGGISSNDHHTRPSAGTGLTESSNTFNVDEANINHNNLSGGTTSSAHHTRPSAGTGLTESSNSFNVDEANVSHDNLSGGTRSDAHHTRYSDSEAQSAVDGANVDISGTAANANHVMVGGTAYEIQKDGTDGAGIINFKTS